MASTSIIHPCLIKQWQKDTPEKQQRRTKNFRHYYLKLKSKWEQTTNTEQRNKLFQEMMKTFDLAREYRGLIQ
ncbi:hypothetical protein QJU93_09850 [Pasteurella skyensis]|uniref:Uncharacterized protein n=1 Tax=Phocoenobacter skyensis TaxID=97481 RepID=A0AAJ6P1E7_9PAST|nr:hypothetical protein [Pasteurella skyensis]MDP8173657.1 hypothetical protein [Pasteurella skyensis]MDP8178025.1 hypothetical protein [Pasteurella skyensis]